MHILRFGLLFGLLLSVSAFGQTFGDISGEVMDGSGAVIPGASVVVTNVGTNTSRNTETNDAGLYRFPSLVPGIYTVRVQAEGFRAAVRSNIELQVQQSARIDFALEVGVVTEVVEVSSDAALLTTDNATLGTVIEERRIVELPLNGRNYLQLVSLSPNVSYGFSTPGQAGGRQGGTRTQQNISVGGTRGTFNNYTLDGIANTDVNFNLYIVLPSVDALQEFKVQSGVYPAEFGRSASQINVSTKPGTNEFHGTAYWFHRNSAVDSRQYRFDGPVRDNQPFRWNQYGVTVGGPAIRNRLFFLGNFEGFKERRSSDQFYTVATTAMRSGDYSAVPTSRLPVLKDPLTGLPFANRMFPTTRRDATALKLLEFWPEPNVQSTNIDRNFTQREGDITDKDQATARIDFHQNDNSQWFGRFSWMDESVLNQNLKLNGTTLITRAKQYMVSNTRVLSPTMVNEVRFGANVMYNEIGQELAGVRDVVGELGLPLGTDNEASWGIPNISITTYSGFGDGANGPFVIDNRIYQGLDNFSWTSGKHSFKFGGEYRYDIYDQIGNEFARGRFSHDGRYSGDSAADFLLGNLFRAEAALALAESEFSANNLGFYVDDVYRMTPKLTLNIGLRWEWFQPYKDATQTSVNSVLAKLSNIANDPDPAAHPVAVRAGNGDFYEGRQFRYVTRINGVDVPINAVRDGRLGDRLINNDFNNFAPRFGIAYSPNANWSFRTGFGIFYSAESGNSRFDMNRGMGGRLDRTGSSIGQVPNTTWQNFLDPSQLPVRVPNAYLWGVVPDIATSYTMNYLFNIQRSLGSKTSFEIGYNGSQSRKLQGLQNQNAPLPGVTEINSRRPAPEYGFQQVVVGGNYGDYNSLGTKLTTRTDNGLTAMLSYTWSKALDNSSAIRGTNADITPQDNRCLDCEYGFSAFDTPQRFVSSVVWEIPFGKSQSNILERVVGGWQLSTILTLQSGRPINSAAGYDAPGTGSFGDPRLNTNGGDSYLPSDQRNTERYWNVSSFYYTAPGTFGNIGRNALRGPSQTLWDMSVMKNIRVREGQSLQARFEFFNFPNHPIWGNPGASWGRNALVPDPNFGRIRSTAGDMRQIQFGLKYIF
jgi:hypothetical protein